MSCAFDKEKLTGYFDGELDPAGQSEVERHISSCSECLRDLGEIKSAALLVRELPRHRAPRSIAESVSREIAAAGGAARFRVLRGTLLWATAAAAALLIAVNVVYFSGVAKREEPASARRPSAAPALATRVVEPAPESGEKAFGKAGEYDRGALEKSGAPADKNRALAPEATVRRAAEMDARNALRKAEGQVDRIDAGLKGDAPAAPPPAPAAPPASVPPPPGMLKDAEELNKLRERDKGAREVAKAQKDEALDLEKGKKADDGKPPAVLDEKDLAQVEAKKAIAGAAAGEQAGGGGGPSVALTLAAADPAAARSRVEAILQKLGARMEPPAGPATAARGVGAGKRGVAPKPLTAALSEKQLAEFRREVQKEKELLLVEGRGAEARKRVEETFRAKAAAKPAAAPAAVAGADPKTREEFESQDKAARPEAPAPKEAPAAEAVQNEALQRQQAEPALIRVTFDFAALETPAAEPK
jgi:hypothetical protein